MELNFEGLDCKKKNVPTDIVQIVGEKNVVICLVTIYTQEDLSVARRCFAQAVTNCLLSSSERTRRAIFYILITISQGVKMIFTICQTF